MELRERCRLGQSFLFDLILYIPVITFQLYRDGSFWVERVLSNDNCVLLKDITQWCCEAQFGGPLVSNQAHLALIWGQLFKQQFKLNDTMQVSFFHYSL